MKFDFDDRPFIVIWEVTRACSLACRHCRAEANLSCHPLELTNEEAFRSSEQMERCRPTLFLMTGGDPIRRLNLENDGRRAMDWLEVKTRSASRRSVIASSAHDAIHFFNLHSPAAICIVLPP